MNPGRNTKRRRGVTLMEVLVSVSIASIAVLSAPTALRIGGRAALVARDGSTAIGLGQEKLEELMAHPGDTGAGSDTRHVAGSPTLFERGWSVEVRPPANRLRRLSVGVRWDDGAHEITLETLVWPD